MSEYHYLKDWVEDLPKKGKSTFSKEEVERQFPDLTNRNILNSLNRLVVKKKIQSVWRGFFAVVLPEHGLRGIVPPMDYIDVLMKYLNKQYYIALLNAAELYGAAHQAPQEFFVMSNTTKLRDKIKKDVKINFVAKKIIPQKHLTQMMTRSGYINVSNPILTAYDLICYANNIGGVNRTATVINELAGKIRFTNVDKEFVQSFSPVVTQRLGYLFEELGFEEHASKLHRKAVIAGLKFRKAPLVIADKTKDKMLQQIHLFFRWSIAVTRCLFGKYG